MQHFMAAAAARAPDLNPHAAAELAWAVGRCDRSLHRVHARAFSGRLAAVGLHGAAAVAAAGGGGNQVPSTLGLPSMDNTSSSSLSNGSNFSNSSSSLSSRNNSLSSSSSVAAQGMGNSGGQELASHTAITRTHPSASHSDLLSQCLPETSAPHTPAASAQTATIIPRLALPHHQHRATQRQQQRQRRVMQGGSEQQQQPQQPQQQQQQQQQQPQRWAYPSTAHHTHTRHVCVSVGQVPLRMHRGQRIMRSSSYSSSNSSSSSSNRSGRTKRGSTKPASSSKGGRSKGHTAETQTRSGVAGPVAAGQVDGGGAADAQGC